MVCGIYRIINKLPNKAGICKCYVGSAVDLEYRKRQHFNFLKRDKHPNKHFQNAYNRDGNDNFLFEIIEEVEFNEDKETLKNNLLEREQYWMDVLKVCDRKYGYNICPTAGNVMGIIAWNKGVPMSEEQKIKLSNAHKGKKLSKETIDKRLKTMEGYKHSEETIAKIKSSNKGKYHFKKFSESERQEIYKKIANSLKKSVMNMDTNEVFNSIKEAGEFYNINGCHIGCVCKGNRKTACGYRWKYVDGV